EQRLDPVHDRHGTQPSQGQLDRRGDPGRRPVAERSGGGRRRPWHRLGLSRPPARGGTDRERVRGQDRRTGTDPAADRGRRPPDARATPELRPGGAAARSL
ncbi:MAG: hypothetical protein AVDCRST_MAG72-199, partial [uncultured Nocardioidaceae bacterium]